MSSQTGACSSCRSIDVRVYVSGLFSLLSDAYRTGMASRAVVGLIKVYFVFRVLVQELGAGVSSSAALSSRIKESIPRLQRDQLHQSQQLRRAYRGPVTI